MAAEDMNIMFSTLADWQVAIKHPHVRTFFRHLMFSPNETESWLRVFVHGVKGPHASLFREYWGGYFLFLALVGNVINYASTGKVLPFES